MLLVLLYSVESYEKLRKLFRRNYNTNTGFSIYTYIANNTPSLGCWEPITFKCTARNTVSYLSLTGKNITL